MNTGRCKKNAPHRFRLTLGDKLNLNDPDKNMALANVHIYYTWKNIKSAYKNNKFKISAPAWNDEFDLPDGSYSVSYIQDCFEYTIKNMKLYQIILLYKFMWIESKIGLFLKQRQAKNLELSSPETMKSLGSTKKDVDQDYYKN